jgi:hypothetical protein
MKVLFIDYFAGSAEALGIPSGTRGMRSLIVPRVFVGHASPGVRSSRWTSHTADELCGALRPRVRRIRALKMNCVSISAKRQMNRELSEAFFRHPKCLSSIALPDDAAHPPAG